VVPPTISAVKFCATQSAIFCASPLPLPPLPVIMEPPTK
jgi:hypothetical protein